MNRREALHTLLKEKRNPGYVPVSTYGVDRYSHPWMAADSSYQRILEYGDQYDHIQALHLSYYASFGLTDILGLPDPEMVETTITRGDDMTITRHILHAPGGDLTAEYKELDGNYSVWRETHLIGGDDDLDRFLSMPFVPAAPDRAAYAELKARLGDAGIVQVQMPNPACLVIENMSYDDFMIRSLTMPDKIDAMLERAQALIIAWLETVLAAGVGDTFRIFGAEYCAPPVMRYDFYHRAVTHYDKPIVQMLHDAGKFVQYHCHGPIRALLDDFLELGVDAIDPCEAPPAITGDISPGDLADRVGHDLVILGNIQLDDIERAEGDTIERLVAETIEAVGDKSPLMIIPTAPPFTAPLPERATDNLIRMIDATHKYGGSPSSS